MATVTRKTPQVKRSYVWLTRQMFEIRLHHPRRTELFRYILTRIPCLFGTAVRLTKADDSGENYDVLLSNDGPDSCECMGFLRHQSCKHLDCVRVMKGRGEIGGAA